MGGISTFYTSKRKAVPRSIQIEEDGQVVKLDFYPVAVGKLHCLKPMAEELGRAASKLWTSTGVKAPEKVTRWGPDKPGPAKGATKDEDDDPGGSIVELAAHDPRTIQKVSDLRSEGASTLISAFLDKTNAVEIAELILSSLRDDDISPEDFVDNISADAWPELLLGFLAANKRVLNPLMKLLRENAATLAKQLESRLADAQQERPSEPSAA